MKSERRAIQNSYILPRGIMSVVLACACFTAPLAAEEPDAKADDAGRYLAAVQTFADNALVHAADKYGEKKTPLLADGLKVETLQPVKWKRQGTIRIVSNFGSQQNFMRTLVGLSALTGEDKYRDRATETTRYMLENNVSPSGLIYWGGHCMYDLQSDRSIPGKTVDGQTNTHELSCNYPYYEFLAEVDPKTTASVLEATWAAHIKDWRTLGMDRHGDFRQQNKAWIGDFRRQPPFFMSRGLASATICSDLIFAGAQHHKLTDKEESLVWTRRMAEYFVTTRDPKTGLGGYRYTQQSRMVNQKDPETGKVKPVLVTADKVQLILGDKYGETALQGKLLIGNRISHRFAKLPIIFLYVAEALGEEGDWYLKTAVEDLAAFDEHVYDNDTNLCQPMFTDGTKLKLEDGGKLSKEKVAAIRRFYPGFQAKSYILQKDLRPLNADGEFFVTAARAYRLSGDQRMWNLAASIAKGNGLPELHQDKPLENPQTDCSDPLCLFGVLELYQREVREDLLALAKQIGDNILRDRIVDGFFLPSKEHIYARLDAPEPLALLHLAAAIQGKPKAVPTYYNGRGYYRASFDGLTDERGRSTDIYDIYYIYPQTKDGGGASANPEDAEE